MEGDLLRRDNTYKNNLLFTDFNECDLQPCGNGGTCVNTPGSYYCNCLPGYTGPDCGTGEIYMILC